MYLIISKHVDQYPCTEDNKRYWVWLIRVLKFTQGAAKGKTDKLKLRRAWSKTGKLLGAKNKKPTAFNSVFQLQEWIKLENRVLFDCKLGLKNLNSLRLSPLFYRSSDFSNKYLVGRQLFIFIAIFK